MTDPVTRISGVKGASEKTSHDKPAKSDRRIPHHEEPDDDNVDISDEARDRASGKKRATILEYLKNSGS